MAERSPYRILLLGGTRTHQEGYARSFQADPRCRLVAVADEARVPAEREALNQQLASELELPYVAGLDAALAWRGGDAVGVGGGDGRGGRVAVLCAGGGKPLYLDKPIACTVPGARAIAAAVRAAGVRSQMFSFSHQPWAHGAREALRAGAVG